MKTAYPVTFNVDFPDRDLDRLATAFRLIVAIPIVFVLGLLTGQSLHYATSANGSNETAALATGGGILFLPIVLMIVFRQKYPRWWFDWNLQLLRFSSRVSAYLALLDDRYPSTDEEQAVHLDVPYPDARRLNRWLPLVKWLLAIPHYIVLFFLVIGVFVAVIIAWFAILFTGRYPRGLFDYVVGVMRWSNRVTGYALVLVTDEYPPFSLG
jgi:roadblock/LC7 domain-containing protein